MAFAVTHGAAGIHKLVVDITNKKLLSVGSLILNLKDAASVLWLPCDISNASPHILECQSHIPAIGTYAGRFAHFVGHPHAVARGVRQLHEHHQGLPAPACENAPFIGVTRCKASRDKLFVKIFFEFIKISPLAIIHPCGGPTHFLTVCLTPSLTVMSPSVFLGKLFPLSLP